MQSSQDANGNPNGSGSKHGVFKPLLFGQHELYARQGKLAQARESLTTAEKSAPGLRFAKPETVQALRSQLTAKPQSKSIALIDGWVK
ncbi:MAG: hypothetical protein P4L87_01835 [Formivibrio sp.]|nr:hypothetical protein [Formivibrio sp.]